MNLSSVGEAWRSYFEAESLSWCIPAQITKENLVRFARSDWIQKMLRAAGLHPGAGIRVLEAGCGTAMYGLCLATLGFDVDAFDYNPGALQFARRLEVTARQIDPDLKIRFSLGDLLNIQAAPDSYDLVFNQAVLDYFQDETERTLVFAEMIRVTKPHGWVAVIVQHTGHPFRPAWERLGWQGYDNQPPTARQTPARLERELQTAGLENVRVDGLFPWKAFFFYPTWHRRARVTENGAYLLGEFLQRYIRLPQFLRKRLGLQFLALGQKP